MVQVKAPSYATTLQVKVPSYATTLRRRRKRVAASLPMFLFQISIVMALLAFYLWLHSILSYVLLPPSAIDGTASAIMATFDPPSATVVKTISLAREGAGAHCGEGSPMPHRHKEDGATRGTEWCMTNECLARLEELKSKTELEDKIWKEQVQVAREKRDSNPYPIKVYKKSKILEARFEDIHEVDPIPFLRPRPEWQEPINGGSFPQLNVVGNLKTGTSQLYNILATHRDVANLDDDWKEHCFPDHYGEEEDYQDTYQYALFQWNAFYYKRKQRILDNKPVVNGCLALFDLEMRYAYNPPHPANAAKFFVLLRDPADWAWAAYNFFCDRSWERYDPTDNWVQDHVHYRSPEIFHELMLSGEKLVGTKLVTELRVHSTIKLRRLRDLVGADNLVVLKNEDLQPHRIATSGVLERISTATGLSLDGFDNKTLHSRSNCNANKGYYKHCNEVDRQAVRVRGKDDEDDDKPKSAGYPVTANRPMLEATRKFVYLQWHEECKIWAEEFGVVYPDCLSILDEEDGYLEDEDEEDN